MNAKELLKVVALTLITTGFAVGCASTGSSGSSGQEGTEETVALVDECQGASPEAKNAIYAAKLKNARARNLGYEWRDTAKLIESAEEAAADCDNVRAKILANKAEDEAADYIAQYHANQPSAVEQPTETAATVIEDSKYIGGYLVVSGDNLWNIAGQDSVYGNPYQWPLIYKENSGQIKDADLIYAGQYFNIPKAMAAESSAAIEHAKTRGAWTLGETEASDMDYLAQ